MHNLHVVEESRTSQGGISTFGTLAHTIASVQQKVHYVPISTMHSSQQRGIYFAFMYVTSSILIK